MILFRPDILDLRACFDVISQGRWEVLEGADFGAI